MQSQIPFSWAVHENFHPPDESTRTHSTISNQETRHLSSASADDDVGIYPLSRMEYTKEGDQPLTSSSSPFLACLSPPSSGIHRTRDHTVPFYFQKTNTARGRRTPHYGMSGDLRPTPGERVHIARRPLTAARLMRRYRTIPPRQRGNDTRNLAE